MLASVRMRLWIPVVRPDPLHPYVTQLPKYGAGSTDAGYHVDHTYPAPADITALTNNAFIDRTNLIANCKDAVNYDGADDAMAEGVSPSKQTWGASEFTIEFYLWIRAYPGVWGTIGATYAGILARNLRLLYGTTGTLNATYTTNGSTDAGNVVTVGVVPLKTWTYITLDRWESSWAWSINGLFEAPTVMSATIASISNLWNWGRQEEGSWFTDGLIAMPRITIGSSRYRGQPFNPPRKPHWYTNLK